MDFLLENGTVVILLNIQLSGTFRWAREAMAYPPCNLKEYKSVNVVI